MGSVDDDSYTSGDESVATKSRARSRDGRQESSELDLTVVVAPT